MQWDGLVKISMGTLLVLNAEMVNGLKLKIVTMEISLAATDAHRHVKLKKDTNVLKHLAYQLFVGLSVETD